MSDFKTPLRDMQFVLHEMLNAEQVLSALPSMEAVDAAIIDQVLDESGKFMGSVLAPLNAVGDEQGCTLNDDRSVTTPDGFADAYRQFVEAGWSSLSADPAFGGQGLPACVQIPVNEMMFACNQAWGMFVGLSQGAYKCLHTFGTPEQKQTYLTKLGAGEWTGTMCLTEPQAGTDLGLLRSKAEPQGDGAYRLTGQKIFISAGEHDLADNIVHLVLARLPDAPAGTRGISLFVVPKFLPDANGEAGERNAIYCSGLEEKMGIHGSPTCQISLEGATGWLVGEPNRGLPAMFVMMNEARLGVGLEAQGLSVGAYQKAVAYAKDRIQGKSPVVPRDKDRPADPIIQHPDVRRMLLTQKAYIEGQRAMAYWTALLVDEAEHHPDAEHRKQAHALVELLTPVVKAFLTDNALICTNLAIQCLGGYGYIREYGVEQYFRDARIKPIYEGTNGIQAMDLLGRKVLMDGGERLQLLSRHIEQDIAAASQTHPDKARAVGELLEQTGEFTRWIGGQVQDSPAEAPAAAVDYLRAMAHLIVSSLWLRAAHIATTRLEAGDDRAFYQSKLDTADFYFARLLPEAHYHLQAGRAGAASLMSLAEEAF